MQRRERAEPGEELALDYRPCIRITLVFVFIAADHNRARAAIPQPGRKIKRRGQANSAGPNGYPRWARAARVAESTSPHRWARLLALCLGHRTTLHGGWVGRGPFQLPLDGGVVAAPPFAAPLLAAGGFAAGCTQ
jgi:hypothetical protein